MMKVPFSRPVSELIQARSSWRSCTGERLPAAKLEALDNFVSAHTRGISGQPLRFELIAAQPGDGEVLRGLGTYGFIRGASGFIVGALERDIGNLEDYGYAMQTMVLLATDLGLATCWLGGSFQKDKFSKRIRTGTHEVVPAVVSVGVSAIKRNLVDRSIRTIAGSKHRKAWEALFFQKDCETPLSRQRSGKYGAVFEMVRLSPSASNKQPWRLVLDQENVHFFLNRTPGYHRPGLFSDLQRIDMGIAMCHFEQMCTELKLPGNWSRQTHPLNAPADWEYSLSWTV